jgi:AAA+ superfamily predicted ATPase
MTLPRQEIKKDIPELADNPTAFNLLVTALKRLDLLLSKAIEAAEVAYGPEAEGDPYRGLHISLDDIELSLARDPGVSLLWSEPQDQISGLNKAPEEDSRLGKLQSCFGLSSFELDALLVCLAPEIDLRYERLYAYLQDDVTKKRPSVDLVLNLLCPSLEDKLAARQCFAPQGNLLRNQLLRLHTDPSSPTPPLLGRFCRVEDRVVSHVFGHNDLDPSLMSCAEIIQPEMEWEDLCLPADLKNGLIQQACAEETPGENCIFYFHGAHGVGKRTTAEALCKQLGTRMLVFDVQNLLNMDEGDFGNKVRLAAREAVLQGATLYWTDFDALLVDNQNLRLKGFLKVLEERTALTFLSGRIVWEPSGALHEKRFNRIEFSCPDYGGRVQLWQRQMREYPQAKVEEVAGKFKLTGGQIRDAAATARNLARWRDVQTIPICGADLHEACRLQSNRKLGALAQHISPRYHWDDIVLPTDKKQQLGEIFKAAKYRFLVYDKWGFGKKLSLGKGLNVLFSGPSGTGKTMAAEIMAGELGLDLYKIDLSSVVSKYIGETEKNLSRIFAEAETANAILFFDEADALFGKRSEVRDAHDRYANIETGYLLQKMEEYDGVVVLATNLSRNMDEAFGRRLHFNIEFPLPNAKDRRRIWKGVWPPPTPLSPDLDLDFMANRFEVTGGNIKNIALAAAFLAADDGGVLSMRHLIRATQREYQKMGKVVMDGEFGEYGRLAAAH